MHVTCSNPDVNHTDKTYPYQESTDDVIGYVQDSAGSYTCTVTVHLGRYRLKYNQDFNREHQFASSLTADVVLQYNGTGWVIASALPLELKLTCGSAHTPDPPGQDVLARLAVLVVCDAISSHTKTYKIGDGDYELKKVDDNTYTVTVIADQYVEKYNAVYPGHTLYDNNTKTIKLVYRYGEWTVVGSNSVTFNVSCEQKYTVTYTDGVDGEVIFNDQVYYRKSGEKTPAFRGTPTRTGYKFIRWEPAVAANVTGNATYTAVWEEAAPQVTKPTKEFLIKEFKIATVKCTTEGSGHGEQSYPLTESSISIGDPVDDGTYYYCLVTVTSAPYVEMFDTATGSTHTAGAATDQQTAYCFDGQNWSVSHSVDGSVLFPIVFNVECTHVAPPPAPTEGAFDNWNIQIKCVRDTSHDLQLRYSDGTYRFQRDDDPQYGRLVFDAASYLTKYNEVVKDYHGYDGNHGLNDATAAVTLELAYKDGQWQPKVPNALPTIQVTCANEPEAPEKPGLDDLKGKIIGIVTVQCVTAPEAHSNQLYSLNENAYDVTGPTLENGQYTCVVTVKAGYYLDSYNTGAFAGPHTISGDTSKKVKLIWDNQNEKWAAADGQKHNIVFNVQCETHTVTYTDGVDGVEVFKDVVHENLPYGTKTPAFYTKDPFRKGYVFTGWNPAVAATVTGNTTYAAVWEEDANGNGKPDKDEEKYTVTYTDGVENEEIFADETYSDLLSGTATPQFKGATARTGYIFTGWNPEVADTVTGNATYTAVWEAAQPALPDAIFGSFTMKCVTPNANHYCREGVDIELAPTNAYTNSGVKKDESGDTPVYYFELTVDAEKYLSQYDRKAAVSGKEPIEHTICAGQEPTVIRFNWNGSSWVQGNKPVVNAECKTEPEKPSGDIVKRLIDVQVVCGNIDHSGTTSSLNDGTFDIGNVTKEGDKYTCVITVHAGSYVNEYNATNPGHVLTPGSHADLTVKLVHNGSNWTLEDSRTDVMHIVFNVSDTYTVTYTDGVENEEIFADQVYGNLLSGVATPAFNGTPKRDGYVFDGWNPAVADKVTESKTYTATWKVDANGNGIADDLEDKFTVTYTDSADGKAFTDQVYGNLLPDTATPAFNGTPTRTGYVFGGWNPAVAATVTGNATYTAVWEKDANGNGKPDKDEEKYTVTYTDGVDGVKVFEDVVHENLPYGTKTPAFYAKDPFRKGYVFTGWKPAVAATVTGNATYAAVWEEDANGNGKHDKDEEKYTVTYTDGVENEEIFADQVYSNLLPDTATPAFNGTPTRTGYVFSAWNPAVTGTVTGNVTYTAVWEEDANGNGTPDKDEEKYTVSYTDGVENEEIFADQVYGNLLPDIATPAFNGTPTRTGYVFGGWNPAVAAKVTGSQTYTATWKADANGNGIADDEEDTYTVTYTDGVKGKAFADQVYDNLLSGTDTPAFSGKPTRKGYTFVSWTPKVTDTVTKTVTYTATWKANSGKDNVPKTGDSGIVPVLGSVLLFSFCGAAVCVFDRKRKHI